MEPSKLFKLSSDDLRALLNQAHAESERRNRIATLLMQRQSVNKDINEELSKLGYSDDSSKRASGWTQDRRTRASLLKKLYWAVKKGTPTSELEEALAKLEGI